MERSKEQEVLDIMMACVMQICDSDDRETIAAYCRRQLSLCGIETVPMGSSWAVIVDKPTTEDTKWEIIEAGRPE